MDLGQGLVWELVGEGSQERIAQECQVGQEVWVAAAGAIFFHERIPPPVIADFHTAPVATNQLEPMAGTVLAGRRTGQVKNSSSMVDDQAIWLEVWQEDDYRGSRWPASCWELSPGPFPLDACPRRASLG